MERLRNSITDSDGAADYIVNVGDKGLLGCRRGEGIKQFLCFFSVCVHYLYGIVDATVLFGERYEGSYHILGGCAVFNTLGDGEHLLVLGGEKGVDDGEGQFTFFHIVARWFADGEGVVVVKDVITDLEADAYVFADGFKRFKGHFVR